MKLFRDERRIKDSAVDRWNKDHLQTIAESYNNLFSAAKEVIIKQNVISLYPDGPDKERAKADAVDAQRRLLCRIANYDGCCNDYLQWISSKKLSDFVNTRPRSSFISSHRIIELAYEDFMEV